MLVVGRGNATLIMPQEMPIAAFHESPKCEIRTLVTRHIDGSPVLCSIWRLMPQPTSILESLRPQLVLVNLVNQIPSLNDTCAVALIFCVQCRLNDRLVRSIFQSSKLILLRVGYVTVFDDREECTMGGGRARACKDTFASSRATRASCAALMTPISVSLSCRSARASSGMLSA